MLTLCIAAAFCGRRPSQFGVLDSRAVCPLDVWKVNESEAFNEGAAKNVSIANKQHHDERAVKTVHIDQGVQRNLTAPQAVFSHDAGIEYVVIRWHSRNYSNGPEFPFRDKPIAEKHSQAKAIYKGDTLSSITQFEPGLNANPVGLSPEGKRIESDLCRATCFNHSLDPGKKLPDVAGDREHTHSLFLNSDEWPVRIEHQLSSICALLGGLCRPARDCDAPAGIFGVSFGKFQRVLSGDGVIRGGIGSLCRRFSSLLNVGSGTPENEDLKRTDNDEQAAEHILGQRPGSCQPSPAGVLLAWICVGASFVCAFLGWWGIDKRRYLTGLSLLLLSFGLFQLACLSGQCGLPWTW